MSVSPVGSSSASEHEMRAAGRVLQKLQRDDPEAFATVLSSHITHYIDNGITKEDADCIIAEMMREQKSFTKPKKSSDSSSVSSQCDLFGAPLTQEGICVAKQLVDVLHTDKVVRTEGLFRKGSTSVRCQRLRAALCSGETVDLQAPCTYVHDVATTFKAFLNELPQPLFGHALFPVYVALADFWRGDQQCSSDVRASNAKRVNCVRVCVQLLPVEFRQLLDMTLHLLHDVARQAEHSRMDAHNLALIFVNAMFLPRHKTSADDVAALAQLLALVIDNWPLVLHAPDHLISDVLQLAQVRGWQTQCSTPTPISPRINSSLHNTTTEQMFQRLTSSSEVVLQSVSYVNRTPDAKAVDAVANTERELAELYAHVQSMPDCAERRKYMKRVSLLRPTFHEMSRTQLGLPVHHPNDGRLRRLIHNVFSSSSSNRPTTDKHTNNKSPLQPNHQNQLSTTPSPRSHKPDQPDFQAADLLSLTSTATNSSQAFVDENGHWQLDSPDISLPPAPVSCSQ